MKRFVAVETEETNSSTETEKLLENTPRTIWDPKAETSPSVSVTSEEVARQKKGRVNPLTQ